MQQVELQLDDHIITLVFDPFDAFIDIDEMTQVDFSNLFAEMITIPALMNKVGTLKALADRKVRDKQMDFDILSAERAEHYRNTLTGGSRGVTKDQVADALQMDAQVKLYRRAVIRAQFEQDTMDGLYWAVKSKEKMLASLGEKMRVVPEEHLDELVGQKINSVMIKVKKKLI